ncbi:GNAT family N-acetyltransferase [Pseudalkalibacillus salsuginis]|uniref:GNAT family N-acetyltransferase n=1 Tax=Pseudalkalibacillus salsuginis TaxID=2910972 RepID=UPI001F275F2D|nr:GNAT family protein [Pseudalkalibacillus salsuginis]MCF6409355.1 GNAT family N-acetyltransferase [Pseudalkalibacillus salsuginis]
MLFKGEKVSLRKMTMEDTSIYHKWQNDMKIAPLVNPFIDMLSIDEVEESLRGMLHADNRKNYIIEHLKDEKPIGYTGLFNINHYHKNAECYIAIYEDGYRGKGVGPEAMGLLMEYVFKEMNMHRLSLRVFAENEHAIGMYKRIGFQIEGHLRETRFYQGAWQDSYIMSILQEDYLT